MIRAAELKVRKGGLYFKVYSSNDPCSRAESTKGEGSAEFAAQAYSKVNSGVYPGVYAGVYA